MPLLATQREIGNCMNENTMDQVVHDGITFLQSLTEHYGSDKGMEIWEGIGEVIGREVKGKIFFAMMTGQSTRRVKFTIDASSVNTPNAVGCIKAIRAGTGLGLKEAKDIYDASKTRVAEAECRDAEHGRTLAKELRGFGCRVY